jgi:hypothetical protein
MALTVVSDPLDPACNSYADPEEMLAYVTEQTNEVTAELWSDLSEEQQATYLVNATRSLDSLVQWIGDRYSGDQRLKWPRYNAFVDGFELEITTFPRAVVEATCEMALWLMSNEGASSTVETPAYDSIRVGPISIRMRDNAGLPAQKVVPDVVALILADYGQISGISQPGSGSAHTVRIERA